MENEVIKLAMSQGLWAVLFVTLLFYVLKENSKRESELRAIIDKLSDKFDDLKKK
ncbi:BhlA/UviB family holin-like peptide [Caloramator sp. Dgby_cultured_2]|uniref:BhlA/UviB family holin-like peptide n=1 Tax=Caloramator sp. Dgby_cultured_2 TaxID=3029174 RepID=UPI00237D354D|nr:BhlA/UviB family holin-like peptide [Caloramator sp. Dgby_cultured_2]WDU82255.1 BhlA/UviB family holin-like peptide [Caloramator sp. Dgby_cultured_2]